MTPILTSNPSPPVVVHQDDSSFEQIRGEIFRKNPKLDLKGTYAAVRREYSQKQVMAGSHGGGPPMVPEYTVMMAGHHRSGEQERRKGQGAAAWGRDGEENELGQAFYRAARNSVDRNSGVDRS